MKKVLISLLLILTLFLSACSADVSDEESKSKYAEQFDLYENIIGEHKTSFTDESADSKKNVILNGVSYTLDYVESNDGVYNERQLYACETETGKIEVEFFAEDGRIATIAAPFAVLDVPESFESQADIKNWIMGFLSEFSSDFSADDISGYEEKIITYFQRADKYDGFCASNAEKSDALVSKYDYTFTYAFDVANTSDEYRFTFSMITKVKTVRIYFPISTFNDTETCPMNMEKADEALEAYLYEYAEQTNRILVSYEIREKNIMLIDGELACLYTVSILQNFIEDDEPFGSLFDVVVYAKELESAE